MTAPAPTFVMSAVLSVARYLFDDLIIGGHEREQEKDNSRYFYPHSLIQLIEINCKNHNTIF